MLIHPKRARSPNFIQVIPDKQGGPTHPSPPSVVVVVILRHKDVVLFQQCSKVLADLSPHIQEGHHYQSNPDKAEGGLLPRGHTAPQKQLH